VSVERREQDAGLLWRERLDLGPITLPEVGTEGDVRVDQLPVNRLFESMP